MSGTIRRRCRSSWNDTLHNRDKGGANRATLKKRRNERTKRPPGRVPISAVTGVGLDEEVREHRDEEVHEKLHEGVKVGHRRNRPSLREMTTRRGQSDR